MTDKTQSKGPREMLRAIVDMVEDPGFGDDHTGVVNHLSDALPDMKTALDLATRGALVTDEELAEIAACEADGDGGFMVRLAAEVRRLQSLVTADEGRAAGFADAVEWLRVRAAQEEAEIDDDCDGVDAERFCATAADLRRAAAEMEQWAKGGRS